MMDKNDAIGVGRNPFDYDAFIRTDAAGLILQANDCAAEILTKSNESIIGRDLWEMIPSSISEKLREEIDRVSDEQIHAGIETYDARRGSWFEYHVCPTETGIVLLILDITARQRSIKEVESAHVGKEERLQQQIKIESEEKNRLKTLQDNLNMALKAAHMATWEFNPVAGVFLVSDGIQNVFGVPPEAAPQTPEEIHNWILPEDFPVHMDRIEKAVTSGEEYVSEFRVRNPQTGDIRWIDSRGRTLKDESGRPIKVYGIVQDITEKKRAHNELEARVEERTAELKTANRILHELEQRIAMVLKNAPIKMSMVDRDLRYTWIYHPLLPNAEKYVGKTPDAFLLPDETAEVNTMRKRVLETGEGVRREIWLVLSGRRTCWDMMMEPLRSEDGAIQGVTTVALDVTERKESEERLKALNSELQQRAEQLRNTAAELIRSEERERRRIAQVLHDHLQQLLVGAKYSLEALLRSTLDSSINPGLEKVKHMLDESLADSRSLTAELAPPMLYQAEFSRALLWLSEWMQDQLGLQVTVQYEDGRQELDQDLKVVLFQSIRELLFNAAKHSKVKQAEVAFYYRDEQIIEICVRDQGIGFDTEKLNSRAKMIGGQGLRGIMDRLSAMGGEVKISSAPGAGTQTTIRVPAKLHR